MLKLGKTIAAKVWLMPGPADYMASFSHPALPPGKHPSIPSLHHLLLGWHKHSSSCMICILPTQKQQAGPSLSKQLLPVATPVQEFPIPKKPQLPFICCNSLARQQKQGPRFTYLFGRMCSKHILCQYL